MEEVQGPCLEVNPKKFVIVMGPPFTAAVLHQAFGESGTTQSSKNSSRNAPRLPAVDVAGMVNEGLSILTESRQFQSEAERADTEQLYRSALEAEPVMKLSTSMQQCGRYAEWLDRCFRLVDMPTRAPALLRQLVDLQDRGALLVYTGCDDVLSKLAGQQVLLAETKEGVERWGRGQLKGIMHVHGVYWKPGSVQLNCDVYKTPSHPTRAALEHLGSIFKERFVLSMGVCDINQLDNPMMAVFIRTFLTVASHHQSFSLTLEKGSLYAAGISSGLLQLPGLRKRGGELADLVLPLRETSKMLCTGIDFPSELPANHQMLALLVATKAGASQIAKMMFSSPGVNFALVNSVSVPGHAPCCNVSVRVESVKLAQLWAWLWEEKRAVLASHGLVAVVMQTGTIVWVQGSLGGPYSHTVEIKQEVTTDDVTMETMTHHPTSVSPKLSPLVGQDFPIPKPGTKKVPRYTVTKLHPARPSPSGTSFTLPPSNGISKVHLNGFSDDTAMYSHPAELPKNVFVRRSSLPPSIVAGSNSDSLLYRLAETCQSVSPESNPPSYTAIKQALLCDKYKRRPSIQTDPKTLKNLLQTKLVISDRSDDLINLRRKSDPGSYMKQRDFERRKELFLDENTLWSKSYGKVIDQHMHRWQRKRQERMQRDILSWQKSEALNPLKHGMLNPLMAAQSGMINPLQVNGGLFPGAFLNTGTSGGVVNPYMLPQGILAGSGAANANNNGPIYYNPFGTQYTLVSPYSSLQLAAASAQAPAAYLVPQATMTTTQPGVYVPQATMTQTQPGVYVPQATMTQTQPGVYVPQATMTTTQPGVYVPQTTTTQPGVFYYMPTPLATTTTAATTSSTHAATATPLSLGHTRATPLSLGSASSVTVTTRTTSGSQHGTLFPATGMPVSSSEFSSQPSIHTPPSPPPHIPRPISPNSRKRHQSVPERLTMLLQPPPPMLYGGGDGGGGGSGRSSPMESNNPDSPPSSKKQRSTSDTTLYHTPIGFGPLSPASSSASPLSSHSTSPQPPPLLSVGTISEELTTLQTHLLQVHQTSYGIARTAQERRRHRALKSGSPRRKHSGGVAKSGSGSPASVKSNEGEEGEQWEGGGDNRNVGTTEGSRNGIGGGGNSIEIKMEYNESENNNDSSQFTLWHFLLDLLVSSSSSDSTLLQWTDDEFEFQILKPVEVSKLWGQLTNTSSMNYDKLLSSLSCYFKQGILTLVQGRKLTFKFAGHIRNYIQMRRSRMASTHEEVVVVV